MRKITADGFEYYIVEKRGIITGYKGEIKDVVIPNEIGGLPVFSIMHSAFEGKQLTDVIIPDSVEYIGPNAFSDNKLTKVVIPDSVKRIGIGAFSDNKLTKVIISNSVKKIADYVFAYNKLTNVVIPDSVEYIGFHAFSGNKLTKVIIPDSVKGIADFAFSDNKLIKVIIPDSVKGIGVWAFAYNKRNGAENLFSIMVHKNQITIIGYNHNAKNVVIPREIDGLPVVATGKDVFYNNKPTTVIIPDSVETIGDAAIIPDSVKTIGDAAFVGKQLTFDYNYNKLNSAENPFSIIVYKNTITIIGYHHSARNVVIPSEINGLPVVAIGEGAFSRKKLTNVSIPDSVKTIGDHAFAENKLTDVVIPDSVEKIGFRAFADNRLKLAYVVIPNSVETIGDYAFDDYVEIIRK